MKQFFIDKLLPPILTAVVIGIGGWVVGHFNPKFIIHSFGGLADGDTVYIQQADSIDVMGRDLLTKPGGPVVNDNTVHVQPTGSVPIQKWVIRGSDR